MAVEELVGDSNSSSMDLELAKMGDENEKNEAKFGKSNKISAKLAIYPIGPIGVWQLIPNMSLEL